ncbi:MAG TPA: tryptophan 2,3-dioxygenase family protein [Ohtaekwangia sp.]|nr:tryptophan 2,3-dioxygenase family protein [Ohtaekwangia sp.]
MAEQTVEPELIEQLKKLQAKYDAMGQDLSSYLDGLLYSDYLTYWDYIHLDTLLSLQSPKTHLPDEKVFIMYHQITELYFRMILHELEQIAERENLDEAFFIARLDRMIRYFENLENSFDIMGAGMEKEQFLKFRMALLPASGFQSAQYRLIEICSTDMINLVNTNDRGAFKNGDVSAMLEKIYWKSGATELASGKKTLTLQQFEIKYMSDFVEAGVKYKNRNLYQLYLRYFINSPQKAEIIDRLRKYDSLANVLWRLAHMKSSAHYLTRNPDNLHATGGTNWQKYLPPRFQKIIFFPELWSEEEKAEWGKAAVVKVMHSEQ